MFFIAEIARLHEVHNAPQIEQAIFQGRAGEGEADFAGKLLHRLGDLRAGVFDELRFVENNGVEFIALQVLEVAPEQRVVGDDDVEVGDLLAHLVARRAAFKHEHGHIRREFFHLAFPVVHHRGGAHDQARIGFPAFFPVLEPLNIDERLERFAEAHIVGEDAAEAHGLQMAEKFEARMLVRPQFGKDALGQVVGGNALELLDAVAEFLRLFVIAELRERVFAEMRGLFHRDFLRACFEAVEAEVGHCFLRALGGVHVQLHPAFAGQFHEAAGRLGEAFQILFGELHSFLFPLGGNRKPIDAAALDDELRL